MLNEELNPNNIPRKNYTIDIGNNPNKILTIIKKEIKNFNFEYGKVSQTNPFYYVVNPCWKKMNENL